MYSTPIVKLALTMRYLYLSRKPHQYTTYVFPPSVISIILFLLYMYKRGSRDVRCSESRNVQNQFDCSASRVLARGRRPGKVSGRILPFSRNHKGFSCIIFAGARRRIASSDGGSAGARIKGGKRGRRDAKNDGGSCGAQERNRASVVSRRQNKSHELY